MKTHTRLLTLTLLLLLAACAGVPASGTSPSPGPGAICNAADAQFAVGRTVDVALQEQARARSGARVVRTLRPGQVVTMEFSAERLNLDVDASGKVTAVRCS
ncbi:MAG: starvation-inducible protein [Ramlibacter sp.]|nr:starvation-inducible protein [Ramlibacter sp.]